ncbi:MULTISPECIES: hypothetical protein [unclassified Colwellia]|uniref:hypothetical protein n=1 Tax=unclassified Colwellia TaxID=196834 RepID=UPI0015F637E0|nr:MULTISPECIES: hypothetical protein [unclassified Colwellia]MBA6231345.1 hypothetical protein [Colwellia sp. MB02u-7]MBA6235167.1 hypothetical protein [Colwellia sp. MB02u-11]MBA6301779.1 hypothetical protein [Colwellia sp. MB3u-22]MBA6312731.1 hypothetical protein [Colwellia sp. MB3u-64]
MSALSDRANNIDWSKFKTAYGDASSVPQHLSVLESGSQQEQLKAAHELWCGLCHQHSFISSAAEPALPILLSLINDVPEKVQVEIMDILLGFSVCSLSDDESFHKNIRVNLKGNVALFTTLKSHNNEVVASFANDVLECLV